MAAFATPGDQTITAADARSGANYAVAGLPLDVGNGPQLISYGLFRNHNKFDLDIGDLAVANSAKSTMAVFIGNGDGTFKMTSNNAVCPDPAFLVTGDFNNDGNLDIAVGSGQENLISVLLGNGDGTFRAAVNYSLDASLSNFTISGLCVADMNNNGKLDLVGTGTSVLGPGDIQSAIDILDGRGDGTFSSPYEAWLPGPREYVIVGPIVAADFNHNGNIDLATLDSQDNYLEVFSGNGQGQIGALPTLVIQNVYSLPTLPVPPKLLVSDLNGDGNPDLVVLSTGRDFSVLLGNHDGTFAAPATSTGNSDIPVDVAIGNVTGLTTPDLITVNDNGQSPSVPSSLVQNLNVLASAGGGTFSSPEPISGGTWTARPQIPLTLRMRRR